MSLQSAINIRIGSTNVFNDKNAFIIEIAESIVSRLCTCNLSINRFAIERKGTIHF